MKALTMTSPQGRLHGTLANVEKIYYSFFRRDRMKSEAEVRISQEERLLWGRMREGDEQALANLFRSHYAILYDYGMKLARHEELVKDGIQEVFAYIWEKRAGVSPVDSVRAYLLVSLRRHLLKTLARQRLEEEFSQQLDVEESPQSFSPEDLLLLQEKDEADHQVLVQAFQEIPPRLREALYLKTYDGLTYREIATIMNISHQVARNYVSTAFHRLRELLSPHVQNDGAATRKGPATK